MYSHNNITTGLYRGVGDEENLRAIVIVPKVDAFERLLANNVCARFVRWAVPIDIPGHGSLAPLSPVGRRW